jgi:hypothetical protein
LGTQVNPTVHLLDKGERTHDNGVYDTRTSKRLEREGAPFCVHGGSK